MVYTIEFISDLVCSYRITSFPYRVERDRATRRGYIRVGLIRPFSSLHHNLHVDRLKACGKGYVNRNFNFHFMAYDITDRIV